MMLSRQFQACLIFFTERFCTHKKHQSKKQVTFTLLEVCAGKQSLPLLFRACLILFCWLMFACECFCAQNLFFFFLKKNRLEIVLITSLSYTTHVSQFHILLFSGNFVVFFPEYLSHF